MIQATVVLIGPSCPTWEPIEAAVRAWPSGCVLATARQACAAPAVVRLHRPSIILSDVGVPGGPIVPLVGDLRAASAASKIVLIGDREALGRDTLLALWHRGVAGCFFREGLHPDTVLRAMETVLGADVLVGSRAILEVLLSPERRPHLDAEGLALSAPVGDALLQGIDVRRYCTGCTIPLAQVETGVLMHPEDICGAPAERSPSLSAPVNHDPEWASTVVGSPVIASASVGTHGRMSEQPTPRELDVLRLADEGLSNKAIARCLQIRERTARFHIENLFGKLDAESRAGMLNRARQHGWLT